MFCQNCGQKLPEGARHCPYCGAKIAAAPPPEKKIARKAPQPEREEAAEETLQSEEPDLVEEELQNEEAEAPEEVLRSEETDLPEEELENEEAEASEEAIPEEEFQPEEEAENQEMPSLEEEPEEIPSPPHPRKKAPKKMASKPEPIPPSHRAQEQPAGKKSKTGLYVIAGLAVILILAVVLLKGVFGGGSGISVVDCVKVTITGVDGSGAAYFDFDAQPIFDAVAKKTTLTERMREEILDLTDDIYKDIVLSKTSELSNGDKIKVSTNVDKNLLKAYKVKLKNGEKTIKVEDLVKVQDINVKDYATVSFSGFDGSGSVYLAMDYDGLNLAIADLIRKADSSEEAETFITQSLPSVIYRISWNYDGADFLSNGDEVSYELEGPEYIEQYGVHFVYEKVSAKAEGLLPVETISFPDYLSISAEGINGSAYARVVFEEEKLAADLKEIFEKEQRGAYGAADEAFDAASEAEMAAGNVKSAWQDQFNTTVSPDGRVSNGDEVTITVTPAYEEEQVTMRGNGFILTGGSKTAVVEGLGDYHLGITSTEEETVQKLLSPFEGAIGTTFEEKKDSISSEVSGTGWIAWDQVPDGKVTPVLEKIDTVTWDGDDSYDPGNVVLAVYHMTLPVRKLDRSVTSLDLYYGMEFDNVIKNDAGELIYDYDPSTRFLTSQEELNSWLEDNRDYVLQNRTNAKVEEVTADLSKEAGTEAATEGALEDAEEAATEAAEEVLTFTAPQAGSIAEGAAGQAAATVVYEGHIYARYDLALNHPQAEMFCEQAGGHLATITSWQENQAVNNILGDASYDEYWIGGSDEEWEGSWKWTTGEAFSWSNWDSDQPDNYNGSENFMTIYSYDGEWNDRPADAEETGFVLEVEPVSEGSPSGEKEYLADVLETASYNCKVLNQAEDPYGNLHFGSLALDASENGTITYELGGKYSMLTANLSTLSDAESDASFEIAIWGDGKLLYSRYNYGKTEAPENIAVDLTGVNRLSIQAANRGGYSNGFLCLNEAKIWKNGAAEALTEVKEQLNDLFLVDSYEFGNYSNRGMNTDVYGNVHEDWYDFEEADGSRAVFKLDGKYTGFTGTVLTGMGDYGIGDIGNLEILADGTVIYSVKDLTLYQGGQSFSLDLTGKKILEIRGSGAVYLADSSLTRPVEAETIQTAASLYTFPELPEAVEERAVDYRIYKDKKYYRFDEGLTWSQADAFCKAAGGTLAMPKEEKENQVVADLLKNGNADYYWLGGYKSGTIWMWNDGETISADGTWGPNQPDNYEEKENFLTMYAPGGYWNDYSDQNLGFVMELTAEEAADPTMVWLNSLEWTESASAETVDAYSNSGRELHPNSVRCWPNDEGYFRVNLNGAYQTFRGVVDPSSDTSINTKFSFAVFGDGKLLYEREDLGGRDTAEAFSVDVSGVKTLTVATENRGDYDDSCVYLLDPELIPAETAASSGIARLRELVLVDGIGESSSNGLFTDAYGELHDGVLKLSAGENAKVTYNLGGAYTTFTGMVAAGENTAYDGGISLKISMDGNLLYEVEDFGKQSGNQSFTVDLTGGQVLEIEASASADASVYVTDDQLK